jgi:hypothetical protein
LPTWQSTASSPFSWYYPLLFGLCAHFGQGLAVASEVKIP